MNLSEAIARHLLEVHYGENWTESWITRVLEDVNRMEAVHPTAGSANTIASLLHHVTFYNRVIQQRLEGIDPVIDAANGFDLPVLGSDEDWERLKADNLQSATALAEQIRKIPDEILQEPILKEVAGSSSYYRQLQGVVEHAHYHLGQIVILKNLIRKA